MIKSVRLLLHIANTSPLKEALDIRTSDKPQDEIFWPGDADPNKVTAAQSVPMSDLLT